MYNQGKTFWLMASFCGQTCIIWISFKKGKKITKAIYRCLHFRWCCFAVYISTTYSPRYEFVTVCLFTQIRIYRVYIDDRCPLDKYRMEWLTLTAPPPCQGVTPGVICLYCIIELLKECFGLFFTHNVNATEILNKTFTRQWHNWWGKKLKVSDVWRGKPRKINTGANKSLLSSGSLTRG